MLDLRKTLNLRRTLDIYKVLDIRRILPLLDNYNGIYRASKAREDKAGRPILNAEEITVSLNTSVKA